MNPWPSRRQSLVCAPLPVPGSKRPNFCILKIQNEVLHPVLDLSLRLLEFEIAAGICVLVVLVVLVSGTLGAILLLAK